MNVVFACTARTGLGHVRRLSLVAKALRALWPSLRLELVANAVAPERPASAFDRTHVVPREDMSRAIAEMSPALVVVDTARIRGLADVDAALALVLRATRSERLADFVLSGGRQWDALLVPHPSEEWSPGDAVPARRVEHTGWISLPHPRRAGCERSRGAPRVVVTGGGGGGDAGREFRARVGALLDQLGTRVGSLEMRWVWSERSSGSPPAGVRTVPMAASLADAVRDADLAITAAGYNTVLELSALDVPAVLVPVHRTYDDQAARAERWASRLGISDADPSRAAAWAAETLARRERRSPTPADTDGARRAARVLAEVLLGSGRAGPREVHEKPHGEPAAGALAADRARALVDQGVPVAVSVWDAASRTVRMPLLAGESAREALMEADSPRARRAVAREMLAPVAALHASRPGPLGLSPLDPWRRVRPRLHLVGPALLARIEALVAALAPAVAALDAGAVVVHGDLHVGQILLGDAGAWLLDLDDLAIGRPESDLGNFLAHLATSAPGTPGERFEAWREPVCEAYEDRSARSVSGALVTAHAAVALVRRALKSLERGEGEHRVRDALGLAESLAERVGTYQMRTRSNY